MRISIMEYGQLGSVTETQWSSCDAALLRPARTLGCAGFSFGLPEWLGEEVPSWGAARQCADCYDS